MFQCVVIKFNISDWRDAITTNNHPVHIVRNDGTFSPSAFIPFCFFKTKMNAMGENIKQFSQPVCRSFRRKILKNQACYEVDVNQVKDETETAEIMNIGLGFLYDNNEERFLHSEDTGGGRKNNNLGFLNNFVTLEETQKTRVYISSLGNKLTN